MNSPTRFVGLAILVVLAGVSASRAQGTVEPPDRIEEITVKAGDFSVVGDLYLPKSGARHPAIIWVHGSGPLTRKMMAPLLKPQIDAILKAGYAFFLDDIPGSGSSTGKIARVYSDRAMILGKEVEALKSRPDITPTQIGMAGLSQAGIVMPFALRDRSDIAFMIAEACVAQNSVEQESYLLEKFMICEGFPAEEAQQARRLNLQRHTATAYSEYREAAEFIINHPAAQPLQIAEPLQSEQDFTPPNRAWGKFTDPMPIIARTKIPVLALFGALDNNVDPVQGVTAYNEALKAAGNPWYRVESIPGANHLLFNTQTGCARELMAQVQKGEPDYAPAALAALADFLEQLKGRLE